MTPSSAALAATRELRARDNAGFTLIELVIVVAIVGILAAIALPSYAEHLRKAARNEATSFLSTIATRQAQFLVDKRRFATTIAALNVSPSADIAAKYDFKVDVDDGPPPAFVLTATAKGDQVNDKCPTLTIDNTGTRSPSGCW